MIYNRSNRDSIRLLTTNIFPESSFSSFLLFLLDGRPEFFLGVVFFEGPGFLIRSLRELRIVELGENTNAHDD
jgi:hypothetical protein